MKCALLRERAGFELISGRFGLNGYAFPHPDHFLLDGLFGIHPKINSHKEYPQTSKDADDAYRREMCPIHFQYMNWEAQIVACQEYKCWRNARILKWQIISYGSRKRSGIYQ